MPARMQRLFWWLLSALVAIAFQSCTLTAADIKLTSEQRVSNSGAGVCWWCCAEMIGKHAAIPGLAKLSEQVLATGPGRDEGATQVAIQHWLKKLQLTPTIIQPRDKAGLLALLEKGNPVIVSVSSWQGGGSHAILVTGMTGAAQDWTDGKGRQLHDQVISYIDPNTSSKSFEATYGWLEGLWSFPAYAFEPARQAVIVEQPAPPAPPVPPVQVQRQLTPHPEHSGGIPYNDRPVVYSSNQDIKDGIQRPLDTLCDYCYGLGGYDYHREYKRQGARK